ncbi:hypothetical protein HAX54_011583, partial [Datura stramonium]|nr:hypothetical protein [Datura stramonium]
DNSSITNSRDSLKTTMDNLMKETLEFKVTLSAIVDELHKIQDLLSKDRSVERDFSVEIGKMKIQIDHLQREDK